MADEKAASFEKIRGYMYVFEELTHLEDVVDGLSVRELECELAVTALLLAHFPLLKGLELITLLLQRIAEVHGLQRQA